MLSHKPVILSCRSRRLSVPLRSLTKPLSLVSYAASWYFFPSHSYSLRVRRSSTLENAPHPVTALISSTLYLWEIRYLSLSEVTRFRRPSPATLICIVLRIPTMGERVFVLPNKKRGKFFSWIIFSTPANASPVSQVMCWRNIMIEYRVVYGTRVLYE